MVRSAATRISRKPSSAMIVPDVVSGHVDAAVALIQCRANVATPRIVNPNSSPGIFFHVEEVLVLQMVVTTFDAGIDASEVNLEFDA